MNLGQGIIPGQTPGVREIRDYTFTCLAGQPTRRTVPGDWISVIRASGEIQIQINDGVSIARYRGMGWSAQYQSITVTSPINQTVVLGLGFGVMHDASNGDGAGGVAGSSTEIVPEIVQETSDAILAAGASAQIVAGSPTGYEVIVQADEGNPGPIRIGSIAVSAAQGVVLAAGATLALKFKGALYVHNPITNGADCAVRALVLSTP